MPDDASVLLDGAASWPARGPRVLRAGFEQLCRSDNHFGEPDPLFSGGRAMRFVPIPEEWREWCARLGLTPGPIPFTLPAAIADVAAMLAATAPAVAAAVDALVSVVHVVVADDEHTDISFSEPDRPYSVFLSVPPDRHDQLPRLADSLVHETLHLQLSMLERLVGPLVERPGMGWSPWKQQERDLSGIVHGLYVHAGLHHVWSRAAEIGREPWASFGQRRTALIARELQAALDSLDRGVLSASGRRVAFAAAAAASASPE